MGFKKGGGGAGAVASVFGRTGVVVAATNDYTDLQVANSPTNKLTTTGDLLYASAANTLARLAAGSTGKVLTISGGLPSWAAPSFTNPLLAALILGTGSVPAGGTAGIYSDNGTDLIIFSGNDAMVFRPQGGNSNTNRMLLGTDGILALMGTNTSPGAGVGVVSAPTSGVAFTPSAGQDCELVIPVTLAGTLSLQIGPSTGTESTVFVGQAVVAGTVVTKRVPKGWKVVLTWVTVTFGQITFTTC